LRESQAPYTVESERQRERDRETETERDREGALGKAGPVFPSHQNARAIKMVKWGLIY